MNEAPVLSNADGKCNATERRSRAMMQLEEHIDRYPRRVFVVLSVAYFIAVLLLSSTKLLWLDELITLHIAKTGGVHAIWMALERGADPNPPVTHVLVHYSRMLFGDHEWAYRLPAMVGYWVGLLSLFAYLRQRVPGTWAIAGTALLMTMAAFEYSYESRSYGIFFGLAMLAFFCWSRAADLQRASRGRALALIGLFIALAGGISTNYFAVLAFLPVSAGEVARMVLRIRTGERAVRVIDWSMWLAIFFAGLPLLAYRGMIEHSIAQFAPYAWNKVSLDQAFDSYTEMVETVLYPLLALFALAVFLIVALRAGTELCPECRDRYVPRWAKPLLPRTSWRLSLPLHESVGVFVFMLYPFLGYVIASIRGGMLSPRFVIPVCYGFAISGIVVAYRMFGHTRRAGLVVLCFLSAWFLCRESVVGYWYQEQKQCFYRVLGKLPEAEEHVARNAPIVIPDPLLALTFQHYASSELAARVVFPIDFPAIRSIRHDDSPEENLWAGRGYLYKKIRIVPVAEFEKSADEYLIIAGDHNWYLQDLARHHYMFDRLPIDLRAEDIGGFTPLAHGTPWFYTASWDRPVLDITSPLAFPVPFRAAEELPDSKPTGATP